MIEQALFYTEKLNFSIIPIRTESGFKKPCLSWKKFQTRKPTSQEITMWWKMWPDAKLGIVTGAVSNLAVVDIDTLEGEQAISKYVELTSPPKVFTPSGGSHLYFRYPKQGIRNNCRAVVGCDLRGEGGYVVAPPSVGYEWFDKTKLHHFPELPEVYIKEIHKDNSIEEKFNRELFNQGTRNEDLFHVANCLVRNSMTLANVMQIVYILAKNCNPSYDDIVAVNNLVMSAWNRRRK